MPHQVGIATSNTSIFTVMVSNFYFIYNWNNIQHFSHCIVIRNLGKNYTI